MRSSKGKVAGSYLHIKWAEGNYEYATDEQAFIISVDHREVLRPVDATKAVLFNKSCGPAFGRCSLGISINENMNAKDNVLC